MTSNKQRKFLGSIGFLTQQPSKKECHEIEMKHTNHQNEFHHNNPRLGKREHIPLEEIRKFNNKKFALIGTSPTDNKKVSKIIHHE